MQEKWDQDNNRSWAYGKQYQSSSKDAFPGMESESEGKRSKVEDKHKHKVEDEHSLVFFICAWLGVGSQFPWIRLI